MLVHNQISEIYLRFPQDSFLCKKSSSLSTEWRVKTTKVKCGSVGNSPAKAARCALMASPSGARHRSHLPPKLALKRGWESEWDFSGAPEELNVALDDPLRMFDLDQRSGLVKKGDPVVAARARAAKIRFGDTAFIAWWGGAKEAPTPLEHLPLSPDTGVYAFTVSQPCCEALLSYLEDGANYNADGFLKMGETQFPGYGAYPNVHAPLGQIAALQERRTVRAHGACEVATVLRSMPLVLQLVKEVRRALRLPEPSGKAVQVRSGKVIKALHFLLQDETEQASFSWHDDAHDLAMLSKSHASEMTTVILNLSDECSGMRIWGCAPYLYREQGDAVAFPGAASHETLRRRRDFPVPRVW